MYTIDTFAVLIGILIVAGALLFAVAVIVAALQTAIKALIPAVISLARKLAPFPIPHPSVRRSHYFRSS